MSTRHTPGPWHWEGRTLAPVNRDPSTSYVYSILDAEGGYGFLGSTPHKTTTEIDACFKVIAAAPNMLAALHKARACILIDRTALADSHTGPDGLDEDGAAGIAEYDETLAVINAAIAEAEGQQ